MEFILKDNFIYIVGNGGLANNKIEGALVTKFVADAGSKDFTHSVNGGNYKKPVNGVIAITTSELKSKYIKLRIKAVSKNGVETFESDKMPFTNAIILGQKLEDAYPEVIKTLFVRLDRVDDNMIKFVETLQAINNKGNLF